MISSLVRLGTTILVIGFITLLIPRITPPGGLTPLDFLLMCGLPVGAIAAGRHWHNGPVFLIYGTVGMLTFVPGYLANGRLGLRLAQDEMAVFEDAVGWTLGIVAVASICNLLGRESRIYAETLDLESKAKSKEEAMRSSDTQDLHLKENGAKEQENQRASDE